MFSIFMIIHSVLKLFLSLELAPKEGKEPLWNPGNQHQTHSWFKRMPGFMLSKANKRSWNARMEHYPYHKPTLRQSTFLAIPAFISLTSNDIIINTHGPIELNMKLSKCLRWNS